MKVNVVYGKVLAVTDKSITKDGTKSTRCMVEMEVPGKWDAVTKSRPTEKFSVWYFDSTVQKATAVLKAAEYLKGKWVVLSYEDGAKGGHLGYSRPTTHGFAECPPELKPRDEDAIVNFNRALTAMIESGELPEYNCDPGKLSDVLNLYANVSGMEGEGAKELRSCLTRLFWGAKYAYIGPVGSVSSVGTKGATRVSVPLYHKQGEEAQWVDVTFWDEQPAANVLKVAKPGDTILMTGLYERIEYNGKRQFSAGKFWQILQKKPAKEA